MAQLKSTIILGSLSVTDFIVEGGTSLASKYAAKTHSHAYSEITGTPTIPAAVTESTVSGWGFTKNTGTVTSVRVQTGTGLSSSVNTAQTGSLDTKISIDSGYKLPTTDEWNAKVSTSSLGDLSVDAVSIASAGDIKLQADGLIDLASCEDVKLSSIQAYSSATSTTFSGGSSGQVLKTTGSKVYWANDTDNNTDTKVTQTLTTSDNISKRPLLLGYSYSDANPVSFSTVTDTAFATHNMYVAPKAGELGIQKLTINSTEMINHIEFKRNNWNYIVASGGTSAAFAFVAGGKSASGANTTLAIYGDKFIPGQRDNQVDMGDSSYHFKNFYMKGKIYNGSYNYTLPGATGTLATQEWVTEKGYVTTDTKNTAGSSDTSSKIYLVGATSQAANAQTYSDNEVYATSGVLTTKKTQVGGGSVTMEYDSTYMALKFVF